MTDIRRVSLHPRRIWLAVQGDTLRCPDGHRLRDPLVWDQGALRCDHQRHQIDPAPCGKLVYILGGGLRTPNGKPLFLLTEVTAADVRHMHEERMQWDEVVAFLGIYIGERRAG